MDVLILPSDNRRWTGYRLAYGFLPTDNYPI